jgi:hypothetical protein
MLFYINYSVIDKKYIIRFALLAFFIAVIKIFSANQYWVEHIYSNQLYYYKNKLFANIFGWCPISIGDILYGLVIIWLMYKFVVVVKKLRVKNQFKSYGLKILNKLLLAFMILYIVFYALWGINYSKVDVAKQLQLSDSPYVKSDLLLIDSLLIEKMNEAKTYLVKKGINNQPYSLTFSQTKQAYQQAIIKYPFLPAQQSISLKSSMYGWLGNYAGFLGYFNPFTGEAQVNTTVPSFLHPFVSCHEVAHQIGYAKESEANFVGYLTASSSTDTFFHYSVYLDMYMYANRTLYVQDSTAAKKFHKQINPWVRADLKEWKQFNAKHQNPIEPIIRWFYGKYLQQNQQPAGIMSYDEVTGFIIAYYKKFGHI